MSIIQRHREAAARTEENDGSEIGLHQAAGKGVVRPLRGRKDAGTIHSDC